MQTRAETCAPMPHAGFMADVWSLVHDSRASATTRLREVAALAGRQGGVVARWQLTAMGYGRGAIAHWIASGRLQRVHPEVYAYGHGHIVWRGRLVAAVLACGPEAVLSHRSAAAWWAILPSERAIVDVTSPGRHRLIGIAAHRHQLDPRDRTEHEGVPITTIARTLLDLAEVAPTYRLAKAIETAERTKQLDLSAIQDLLRRSPGRHGHSQLRLLLNRYTQAPLTRSELEETFWRFIEEHDLPRPDGNAGVAGHEVDFLWEQQRVIAELDSWEFHGTRAAFERDRERDLALTLAGYTVIRVTARRLLHDRKRLAQQLKTLLALQ
jgi:very-short-patch-repair endonuclease